MQKIKYYFMEPYAEKGFLKATADLALRLLTLVVWVYLMCILGQLLIDALIHNFSPVLKMWWFAYCFIVGFGGTWIAYIILFMRDYYEAQ